MGATLCVSRGYQQRLHDWASIYQKRGCPVGTPHYLLTGYYQLLDSLGDLPRMAALAGDQARHKRMLDLSGAAAAALAEARTALNRIAAQDAPDLAVALYLAWHRDQLADRNTHIPASQPAVWATLGNTIRAQTLATCITDPCRQAEALAQVAEALIGVGQLLPAGRQAAATWALGQWTNGVKPVLAINPSAFAPVARALDSAFFKAHHLSQAPSRVF